MVIYLKSDWGYTTSSLLRIIADTCHNRDRAPRSLLLAAFQPGLVAGLVFLVLKALWLKRQVDSKPKFYRAVQVLTKMLTKC